MRMSAALALDEVIGFIRGPVEERSRVPRMRRAGPPPHRGPTGPSSRCRSNGPIEADPCPIAVTLLILSAAKFQDLRAVGFLGRIFDLQPPAHGLWQRLVIGYFLDERGDVVAD